LYLKNKRCIGQDEIELHDDGPHIKTDDPLDDKYLLLELLSNNEDGKLSNNHIRGLPTMAW
jgi:hypothetical protein